MVYQLEIYLYVSDLISASKLDYLVSYIKIAVPFLYLSSNIDWLLVQDNNNLKLVVSLEKIMDNEHIFKVPCISSRHNLLES